MPPKIVVLGATGYTGDLIVEALASRGVSAVLAGRNPQKLAAASARHAGMPTQVVDATDAAAVAGILSPGDVLISTVGPFEKVGWAGAEAAVRARAHYLDTTGEVGFVQGLQNRHDAAARAAGIVMLPAFGYDYVPGMLAGALALERAGSDATTLRIGYFAAGSLRGGLSKGTRATLAAGILQPSPVWRDGRLQQDRTAGSTHTFNLRGSRSTGILVSGTEVLFLPALYPTVRTVEDYNGWFPRTARLMPAVTRVARGIGRVPVGRRLIERIAGSGGGSSPGPDAATRARTRTRVVATASDATGAMVAEAHLSGPSPYTLTAELVARAAERLRASAPAAVGVQGPVQGFGLAGLQELSAEVGMSVDVVVP
ncbi:saccharopine dehydrogenase NADP-binding domain-containing protein [Microbacterium sp. Sa4CUA7]|uniref:Saccharopine dehydrogenase NADP-binding domain-containing protein n=1 Tax=Microbacterium pullorum TaxID=2762236 RepID=A0ABR8S344_9MICO|nr:saccharopine dehydrogenase NADP-binding domain-containing protein [Microbacterium pullorum]MBD7957896.1 saccharopine dehydrogenase NADP-binding domain-containing protein [Microbacterium pullorum]